MKKFAPLIAIALATLFSLESRAQIVSTKTCGSFDTTVIGTTPMALLMNGCNFTAGPNGILYAVATGETFCTGTQTVQMLVASGSSTVNGSNFLAAASSGVLTVSSVINGMGLSPFQILPGQTLSGQYGSAQTTIVSQTNGTSNLSSLTWSAGTVTVTTAAPHGYASGFQVTIGGVTPSGYNGIFTTTFTGASTYTYPLASNPGTETVPGTMTTVGGPGTYSIADATITASAGTNMYTLNPPPGGTTAITPPESQNLCNPGFVLTTIAGSFVGAPGATYNIILTDGNDLSTTQSKWNNSSITIITY